jgi:hypothetical protein
LELQTIANSLSLDDDPSDDSLITIIDRLEAVKQHLAHLAVVCPK